MEKNRNRVPKKQWTKWSEQARRVFNRVYMFCVENEWAMRHPKSPKPKTEFWETTAWNAAWIAADAVDDTLPTHIVEVDAA